MAGIASFKGAIRGASSVTGKLFFRPRSTIFYHESGGVGTAGVVR
jgi:hypothetical protein